MKMLVVTSCTGEKIYHPDNQLTQADFADAATLSKREAELAEFKTTAGKIYTGMQHQRLMEGIETLRSAYGKEIVDLYVVSAGYGLISEDREVVPYEVTFNTMNGAAIKEWSQHLGIHHDLSELVQKYDLVLFLLGDKYLKAIDLPFDKVRANQKLVFFASGTSKKMIPTHAPYYFVEVGQEDAKSFSYGLVGLKGYLFKLMALDAVNDDPLLFEKVYKDPRCTPSLLDKHRKVKLPQNDYEQLTLFPVESTEPKKKAEKKVAKKELNFYLPREEYAKNYTGHMKYFIPEWDDRVDPNYDFITDTSAEGRDSYTDDVYAHEIYKTPNYDGILVSKVIVEESKKKKNAIESMGIHEFKVKPDMTRITMTLSGVYKEYGETLRRSSEDTELLREVLSDFDFERPDLKTLSFDVDTEYESYRDKNNDYKQRFVGYRFNHILKVEFESDNERLGKILYALANCKVKPEFRISYTVKDPEGTKNLLLGKAVTDAKEKAAVLTQAGGVSLKDIQSIDYSWGEIDFEYRPMRGAVLAECCEVPMAKSYDLDIEPDDIEVSDTVTVVWEIA